MPQQEVGQLLPNRSQTHDAVDPSADGQQEPSLGQNIEHAVDNAMDEARQHAQSNGCNPSARQHEQNALHRSPGKQGQEGPQGQSGNLAGSEEHAASTTETHTEVLLCTLAFCALLLSQRAGQIMPSISSSKLQYRACDIESACITMLRG